MHSFSTIPYLLSVLLLFWFILGLRSVRNGLISASGFVLLTAWLICLGAWGLLSAKLAISGVYATDAFLRLLPGFWIPMVPIALTLPLVALPKFRTTLYSIIVHHQRAFVFAQAMRLAAIGGVIKGFKGLLPVSFALPVGIPDLAFGLSALAFGIFWSKGGWTPRRLLRWNLVGIGVIIPLAPLAMQMGLPGQLYIFTTAPDARALFDFPMVIAPTLIVPVFITMNAIHAVVCWHQLRVVSASSVGPAFKHSQAR